MFELRSDPSFTAWLSAIDAPVRQRVAARLIRVQFGNLGDHKMFGSIGEMRIDFGPGYRVYFTKRQNRIVILLGGGSKKTQTADIPAAKRLAEEY